MPCNSINIMRKMQGIIEDKQGDFEQYFRGFIVRHVM